MKTQVLIIGAGPVGLMSALLLSNQGVSSIVVDRRFERMTAPKAHAVNPRTIEICDQAGLPGNRLRADGSPIDLAGSVRFASTLSGTHFGALPYERQTEAALEITPFPLINISQPKFEAQVAAVVQERANVSLLRGAQCDAITQDERGAEATILLRGVTEPLTIQSDYVLAADGAGSRIRESLAIGMEGPDTLQNYIMIHCEGDLSPLTKDKPGVLYFTFDPLAGGVFIFYDDMKTWVFMKSYDPASEPAESFDEARCRRDILEAIGVDDVSFVIKNISPWRMSAQVAESYRRGRVFLVGDAAHRFPPTGGLGLNTGVGDAHNLAWKIAKVLGGEASDTLLDTYEVERRPIAQHNTEQSMTNAARIFDLFAVLYGDEPEKTPQHFAEMCSAGAGDERIKAAIEVQRPHFDSIRLQLGYRYHSDALIGSVEVARDPNEDISVYAPCFDVGAPLPHAWMDGGNTSILSHLCTESFSLVSAHNAQAWKSVGAQLDNVSLISYPRPWSASEMYPEGALLIRPDGHIAARYESAATTSVQQIQQDIGTVLQRPN